MIYVKLKEFRAKHRVTQSDLAKLWGIGQTDVSRMEKGQKSVTEEQYKMLEEKYGADDVAQYVMSEPPYLNAIKGQYRKEVRQNHRLPDGLFSTEDMAAFARIIADQQKTIIKLEEEIERLKNQQ